MLKKKSRIYAGFGVSQTPNTYKLERRKTVKPFNSHVDDKDVVITDQQSSKEKEAFIWEMKYEGYHPGKDEYSVESLLTVGNGYFGLRGTLPEMKI